MTYFRVESKMPLHEKHAPLSDSAFRLNITAGCWCAERFTDGFIPKAVVPSLPNAPRGKALSGTLKALVDGKVWVDRGDRYELHDYLDYNISRADWEKKVVAGSAGGRQKAANRYSKPLAPASQPPEQNASTTTSYLDLDPDLDLTGGGDPRPDRLEPAKTAEAPPPPQSEQVRIPAPVRRIRATDDLMGCPIHELAGRCRANPHDASLSPIAERPELVQVNAAWSGAVGVVARPLGAYSDGNHTLKTLLAAFETASLDQLLRVCELARTDEWCQGTKGTDRDPPRKRDIGCLSKRVLDRMLVACDVADGKRAKREERDRQERAARQAETDAERNRERVPPPKAEEIEALIANVSYAHARSRAQPIPTERPSVAGRRFTREELDDELAKRPKEAV